MVDPALAHLLSQTRQNIVLLQELRQVSHQDADIILSKLPQADTISRTMTPNPAAQNFLFRARAKFNYHEGGRETRNLSFSAGDVIDVVKETNASWWYGRLRGQEGPFPSSYVERLPHDAAATTRPVLPHPNSTPHNHQMAPPYPMPPQTYYGTPPPPQGSYTPYGGPPPSSLVVQQPQEPKKNSLVSGLGNTVRNGGTSLRLGSDLATGIIKEIF